MRTYNFVRYDVNGIALGGNTLHGVQTVTLGRSMDVTTIVTKGRPTTVNNWYKKPSVTVSFTRFLSGDRYTTFSLLTDTAIKTPPGTVDIDISPIDGAGIKARECRLKSLSFNLTNEGNFTESVTYEGVTFESGSVGHYDTPEYGTVLRRQDFLFGTLPSEVSGKHILTAEAAININYGHIPTWGQFNTNFSSYISVPVDITCSFEVLETSIASYVSDYSTDQFGHGIFTGSINPQSISINSGGPVVNLGSQNFISNVERTGGDVGGTYTIYKYTYRNTNNYFSVT